MKRFILGFLLVLLMTSLTLGWDLSLAPGLSVKNAFLYLIIMVWMIETAVFQNRSFDLPSVVIPFAVVVFYSLISWFTTAFVVQRPGYDTFRAAISLKTDLIDHFIVFLIFFYGVATVKDSLSLVRLLIWIAIIGNLLTVLDAFDMPDLGIIDQRDDGRVSGPVGESNAYGAFIAMTLPGIIALVMESRGKQRLLALLGAFVTVLALFLAASRGAIVGLIAGGAFSAFYLRAYVSARRVTYTAAFAVIAVASMLIVFYATGYLGMLEERFVEQNTTGGTFEATSSRSTIWTLAVRRMLELPYSLVVGFGWDAYDYLGGLFPKATHNFYLNRLFNLGFPGLTLYLMTFYGVISKVRTGLRRATGPAKIHLMGFVFGFTSLGGAIFFIDLHAPWIFIWAYIGLATRLAVQLLEEEEEAPQASAVPSMALSSVTRL